MKFHDALPLPLGMRAELPLADAPSGFKEANIPKRSGGAFGNIFRRIGGLVPRARKTGKNVEESERRIR